MPSENREHVKCEFDLDWIEITIGKRKIRWGQIWSFKKKDNHEIHQELKDLGVIRHDDRIYVIDKVHNQLDKKKTKQKLEGKAIDAVDDPLARDVLVKLASKMRGEATEMMVEEILGKEHIYTTRDDEKAEMWIYHEGIYISQAKTYIKEYCRETLGDAYTTSLGNDVIAKIETDTYINSKEFFVNDNVNEVAVENGLLELNTRELAPFTPEKIFFNKLPVMYNPQAECPNVQLHFQTVLKDSTDIPVIEELFGYLLYKEYKIEKAFMFVGNGRNGKGKTLALMKRFIGAENCANVPLQQFENDSFALGELFNKMANLSGDIDKQALKHTGTFKNVTGRDLISASRKYLSRVNFENYAKMIFCANELPDTYDKTLAFWDRWVLLEFPYTFISQEELDEIVDDEEKAMSRLENPDIIKKLATKEELSGLLNLALDGLKRLLKQKDFSYSKSREDVKNMWIRKADSFSAFLMDEIEEEHEGKILKSELRQAYASYCKEHRLKMNSDKAMKHILTSTFGVSEERESVNYKQVRYWWGIKFKNKNYTTTDGFHEYRDDQSIQEKLVDVEKKEW